MGMEEYGGTLLCVCLLGSVVRMLSPEGDMKRYVGLVTAFCVLLAIANPLTAQMGDDGFRFFREMWEEWEEAETVNYDEIYDQSLMNAGGALAENQIKNSILKEFSLTEEDLTVRGSFAMKNGIGEVRQITLYLHKSTLPPDPRELWEYVTQRYSCPCEILYDIDGEK